jgi:hypothetical protein
VAFVATFSWLLSGHGLAVYELQTSSAKISGRRIDVFSCDVTPGICGFWHSCYPNALVQYQVSGKGKRVSLAACLVD